MNKFIFKIKLYTISKLNKLRGKPTIHFLHIGKTGGTAIKVCLKKLRDDNIILHKHNITLPDIPKDDKVFFILRNPITRFVSGFNSRQRKGAPRYFFPWTKQEEAAFTKFNTANELAESLSSKNNETKTSAELAMRNIQHVKESYYKWIINDQYFESRKKDILFIGFQEDLDSDFKKLKTILKLPEEFTLPTNEVEKHSSPEYQNKYLSETAISNLNEWYKKDIGFYNYCKSLYK